MLSFFIRFFLRTLELFKGNSSPKKSIATILKWISIFTVKKHLLANDFVKDGVGKFKKMPTFAVEYTAYFRPKWLELRSPIV